MASVDGPKPGVKDLLDRISEVGLQLFVDATGRPQVVLPGDTPGACWWLWHSRVRGWVAVWYFRLTTYDLRRREIDRALTILEGQAWESSGHSTHEVQLWAEIDKQSVAHAVVAFMATRDDKPYRGSMSELFRRLSELSSSERRVNGQRWPGSPGSLSAKLGELTPLLGSAGIIVSRWHSNAGGQVMLTRSRPTHLSDTPEEQSSSQSSPVQSGPSNDLDIRDAVDGVANNAALLQRLNHLKTGKYTHESNGS